MNGRRRRGVTAEDIRACLSGSSMPADPTRVDLPPELSAWPSRLQRRLVEGLRPAGVLVPIVDRGDGLSVLLTRRSAALRYHAGQVAFPGGRMDPADDDILATALREAWEEIGIRAQAVEVAGFLPPTPTITGYAVTPVIGFVPAEAELKPDPREVERAFEVPLSFLLDEANLRTAESDFDGQRLPVVEYLFGKERIWGATANIVLRLRSLLTEHK